MSSGRATTSQPQSRAASTLPPLTLSTNSAPLRTAAATSVGLKLSMETRCPTSRKARTQSPAPVHVSPGSQPTSITSAPSARNAAAWSRIAGRRSRGAWLISAMMEMSNVLRAGGSADAWKKSGRSRRSFGPRSTTASAGAVMAFRSPEQSPGRMTRRTPSGMVRCRAIHGVVARATTVIGSTATDGVNPARAARSSTARRRAGSASLPVTNSTCGGSMLSA